MDVYKAIKGYYSTQEGQEPEIRRVWVEEYLQELLPASRGRVWEDINAFSLYLEEYGRGDLPSIPHWHYSAFVTWAVENISASGYSLHLIHVRRLMGNLRGFFEYLVDKAHIPNLREISQAYEYICGHEEVRLTELLPYTGTDHWLTARTTGKENREVKFSVSDYWLLLLFVSTGGSWKHIMALASDMPRKARTTRKLSVYNLRQKLKLIGYAGKPADLLMTTGTPMDAEIDTATRWFLGV